MKIGPYNPMKNGLSKYKSLKLLTLHKYDPKLNQIKMEECAEKFSKNTFKKYSCIFISSTARARGTAKFLMENNFLSKNAVVLENSMLNEIKFDMKKLCTQKEYEYYGSAIVRQRFIEAFIDDTLGETRKGMERKCIKLHYKLKKMKSNHESILIISHTFFIKIFLIYLKNKKLFQKPEILKKFIDPTEKIMDFCQRTKYLTKI